MGAHDQLERAAAGHRVADVPFTTFVSYPFVAAWVSGDTREHHLLQRPRDVPNRTAFLAAMVTLCGVLWAAGGNDVIALVFHLNVNTEVETFRAAVVIAPVIAFMVARRWCLGLQRQDRDRARHPPPRTGRGRTNRSKPQSVRDSMAARSSAGNVTTGRNPRSRGLMVTSSRADRARVPMKTAPARA